MKSHFQGFPATSRVYSQKVLASATQILGELRMTRLYLTHLQDGRQSWDIDKGILGRIRANSGELGRTRNLVGLWPRPWDWVTP